MKLRNTRLGQILTVVVGALALASVGTGCAIHTQAPIREVAYDFSDAEFYDRGYASSPTYETGATPIAPLRQTAEARADRLANATASNTLPPLPSAGATANMAASPQLPAGSAVITATPSTPRGSYVLHPPILKQ